MVQWSNIELDYLRNHFLGSCKSDIQTHLPNRAWCSIVIAASRLGLDLKSDIILDIQKFYKKHCKISKHLYKQLGGKYSDVTVANYWGNWNHALNVAGIDLNIRRDITDEEILQDMRCTAQLLNKKTLSYTEYSAHGQFHACTPQQRFHTWNKALKKANLQIQECVTRSEMLSDAQRVVDEFKLSKLTTTIYTQYGKFSASGLQKKFGSWNHLLSLLKLPTNNKQIYSKKQLSFLLKKLCRELGYAPSTYDMLYAEGYPSDRVYFERFKTSWANILLLSGIDSTSRFQGFDGYWYDSKEEVSIANLFYRNFINYEPHKLVYQERKWTCDFYLADINLWVEYDGLGAARKQPEKFLEKINYYKKHDFNFVVLTPDELPLEFLGLVHDPWEKDDYQVLFSSFQEVEEFLTRVHYLGPRKDQYYIKIIQKFNKNIVGVCTFGNTANPYEKNLCLNRFATLDTVGRNFGSFFMSQALKLLKRNNLARKIVSWSDPRYHLGSLYKACNFQQIHKSYKQDYVYIDKDGKEHHKSVCRVAAGKSEATKAKSLGFIKVNVPAKIKWEIILRQ